MGRPLWLETIVVGTWTAAPAIPAAALVMLSNAVLGWRGHSPLHFILLFVPFYLVLLAVWVAAWFAWDIRTSEKQHRVDDPGSKP